MAREAEASMSGNGIETKLAVLRDNLARLASIPQSTLAEFAADFRNVDSALHRLQTSIQACRRRFRR